MATEPDQGLIFLASTGVSFTPNHLSWLVRKYIQAADVAKNGACHIFRHTMHSDAYAGRRSRHQPLFIAEISISGVPQTTAKR